jgi:transposase-like protein
MGRPIKLPEPWKTLAEKAGGVAKLAARLGVDPSVLRRWVHGRTGLTAAAKSLLDQYLRDHYTGKEPWPEKK